MAHVCYEFAFRSARFLGVLLFLNEFKFRQFPALDFFLQRDVLVKRFLNAFMVLLRLYRNKEKVEKGEETEFNRFGFNSPKLASFLIHKV